MGVKGRGMGEAWARRPKNVLCCLKDSMGF